jgi:hypothetical protein
VPQLNPAGGLDAWEQLPTVRGGRFIASEADDRAEWEPGYFEHLLKHPELVIAYEPPRRVFYICTQHAAARAGLEVGLVPSEFACPLVEESCPLLALRGSRLTPRGT